jgi:hypothetical protein
MSQVHKETLSAVDNALPNRAGLDIEIFGMEGIPEEIIQQHNQRVLTQYHQAEAERRVASGSAGGAGGAAAGNQPKKPKFESPSDLKRRLAEHKAKLAAEQANGGSSGGGTPLGAGANQSPAVVSRAQQILAHLYSYQQQAQTSSYPQQQQFNGASTNASFNLPPGYGQPPQQAQPFQQPGYGQPPQQGPPPFPQPGGSFPQQSPFSPPPFQNQAPYSNPQFQPQTLQQGPPQFQGGPPGGAPVGPPRSFVAGSPVQQFAFQQQQLPPRNHTPSQNVPTPQRSLSGSLPPAPGLPQRPAFGAPHVNHFQMQQMHQGQLPGPPNVPVNQPVPGSNPPQNTFPQNSNGPQQVAQQLQTDETSLDDLITGASKQAEEAAVAREATDTPKPADKPSDKSSQTPTGKPADETVEEKKDKKEKSKASHLVYSDQETSPEEKMARMPRYAFTPVKTT